MDGTVCPLVLRLTSFRHCSQVHWCYTISCRKWAYLTHMPHCFPRRVLQHDSTVWVVLFSFFLFWNDCWQLKLISTLHCHSSHRTSSCWWSEVTIFSYVDNRRQRHRVLFLKLLNWIIQFCSHLRSPFNMHQQCMFCVFVFYLWPIKVLSLYVNVAHVEACVGTAQRTH